MGSRVFKGQAKALSLSTTGDLLDMYGWSGARKIEISSEETSNTVFVYLETGQIADGGTVGAAARAIPCSALPVEVDVYGQGDGLKLYGSAAVDVVAVVR